MTSKIKPREVRPHRSGGSGSRKPDLHLPSVLDNPDLNHHKEDAKIFCVTCCDWFYESNTGQTDGKVSECQPCTDKRDAARYRYLRNRDIDAINKGGIFAGMTPDNFVLNGIDLDQEIDKRI